MKIQRIEVKNLKAVTEQSFTLDGCSVIVTAGNDQGKTTLLKSLLDRMRGVKPEVILKEGQEKGYNIMDLTDGSRIEWKFTEKGEQFAYITKEGIKQTTGVLKAIGERYFGKQFNIDKFLMSPPKQQIKQLQSLVGADFEEIDERLKNAQEERKEAKKELEKVEGKDLKEPEKVDPPDIDGIKDKINKVKEENKKLYEQWQRDNEAKRKKIEEFNREQNAIEDRLEEAKNEMGILLSLEGSNFSHCIDFQKAKAHLESFPKPKEKKEFQPIPEPEYYSTEKLEQELQESYRQQSQYEAYDEKLTLYQNWVEECDQLRKRVDELELKVKAIEQEKKEVLANANIPDEFEITEEGIKYKGYPLTDEQISSSGKYIASLKLGSLLIGELRTLHFDASHLDKKSLDEVEQWANENDLQLLIERPDYDGSSEEFKYEII